MSFDRLARHYRWMEFVLAGTTLQRARTAFLPSTADARRALLVGEGNGRFLRAALAALPRATFHCVDASGPMLERAKRGLSAPDRARVTFEVATLPRWTPPGPDFDLVATHFFLDCFPAAALAEVIALLASRCAPGATWLVADFAVPTRGIARTRARLIHWSMYRFFRWTTNLPASELTPPEPLLAAQAFHLANREDYEWGLVRSSAWRRGPAARS